MPISILLAAALVLMASQPALADSAPIRIRVDGAGAVIVPVMIDGQGPFPMLFDTGSSHSVVSSSLADRLSLRLVAKTSVLTSTGREMRPVATLDLTTIGVARSEGLLATVTPSAQLAAIAHGIEGIIGQDFLFVFNYTLDYRRQRLVWLDDGATIEGVRLPLVAQEGRYLVQAGARDSEPILLVPDTGASGFVAYERDGRTRLELGAPARPMGMQSLSGRQDVRTMVLRELSLGTMTVRNQPVAVVARDPGDVLEGDGLLPLHLFASVTFNASEGYLIVRK